MTKKSSPTKSILFGVGILLLLNAAAAFFVVYRAKEVGAPALECAEKKWGWTNALEQLEWNLRRWEMVAPGCIKAGMPIVMKAKNPDGYEVRLLESVRPITEGSSSPTAIVTASHTFRSGATVWVCGEQAAFKGRISGSIQSGKKRTLLNIEFEKGYGPDRFVPGMVVVAVNPSRYSLATSRSGRGSVLTLKKSMQAAAPVAAGVDRFSIEFAPEKLSQSTSVHVALRSDGCLLDHRFSMAGSYPWANQGAWMLKGETLDFVPWIPSASALEAK